MLSDIPAQKENENECLFLCHASLSEQRSLLVCSHAAKQPLMQGFLFFYSAHQILLISFRADDLCEVISLLTCVFKMLSMH